MLIQLVKELFLLAFWREATLAGWKAGWREKKRPGLIATLVGAGWILTLALLVVSIPHSVEVIFEHERGATAYRVVKAVLLAVAIEVVPALLVLTAFHTRALRLEEKGVLLGLALPFLVLTTHMQLRYYGQNQTLAVQDWELALVLPVGALVGAVLVALLLPHSATEPSQPGQSQREKPESEADLSELKRLLAGVSQQVNLLSQSVTELAADVGQRVGEVLAAPKGDRANPNPEAALTTPVKAESADTSLISHTNPEPTIAELLALPSIASYPTTAPYIHATSQTGAGAADGSADGGSESIAAAVDLSREAERNRYCYELKLRGKSYAAIGREIGRSETSARAYVAAHCLQNNLSLPR
jgi:hypothetical protein